ncbi:MAG: hypothetical protein KBS73_03135 [Bacteroidales bacterium]|nr:hypothetical protein [Candidatus Cacconaster equifaecalis]
MKKLFTIVLLPIVIIGLVFLVYSSISKPVKFDKERDARKAVAIQQLKDIRELEVAFKSVYTHFTSDPDSLKDFYLNGKMKVDLQIGSPDDSAAVANTDRIKKAKKGITNAQLYDLYQKGEKNLVFIIESEVPTRETILVGRNDFDINKIDVIPFSEGDKVIFDSVIKTVSGVQVPLFEAKMPYNSLLKGMDHQLIVNLNAEMTDTDRYPGLMVGSVENPNNNAGNWE